MLCKKHEKNENHRIPYNNNEKHKNIIIPTICSGLKKLIQ